MVITPVDLDEFTQTLSAQKRLMECPALLAAQPDPGILYTYTSALIILNKFK
jgi:hypothetical protein